MRAVMALALVISAAALPALAVEHTLVRWRKTGQCEIVTSVPLWGDHWIVLGEYDSHSDAERALAENRRSRACPMSKSAKRAERLPADERATVLHRSPEDRDRERRRRQEGTVLYPSSQRR
jgi:hypothetical protein